MAKLSNVSVKTFSIGLDDPQYDELPHARRVANAFGCDHQEFVVRPSAADILPAIVRHFGEPYADSSAVPSWYLAKLTRERVTVALNGDGGDELFAGYGRHLANDLAERWQKIPPALRRSAERFVVRSRILADAGGSRLSRFASAAALSRSDRYRAWAGVFSPDLVRSLSASASEDETVPREFAAAADLDAVDSFLAVDTNCL